jgi:uncharacterized protein YjbI with pentapeptide repeats
MNREDVLEIVAEARAKGDTPDLSWAYLYGAYLYGSDLRSTNMRGANMRGANMRGANLYGANLRGANLRGANLRGANLRGADLSGADLSGADLRVADLYEANLYKASLSGAKLAHVNGLLVVGPGGSRKDLLYAVAWDNGPRISCGCFWGTVAEFRDAVLETHSDNRHAAYYTACIAMIEAWWKAYEGGEG